MSVAFLRCSFVIALAGISAVSCLAATQGAGPPPQRPNIIIVVADDLGVDSVQCYQEGVDPPPTPNVSALARSGISFRNAWANPVCSPTRATILTGRYSFRTGIGHIVTSSNFPLQTSEILIPEVLDQNPLLGYSHAAFGKWHLGNASCGGSSAPNVAGFDHFDGSMFGFQFPDGYYSWTNVVDGVSHLENTFEPTATVDDVIQWTQSVPEPWFAYTCFLAPHAPYTTPPPGTFTVPLPPKTPEQFPLPYYQATVQAMDFEIGRLMQGLAPVLDHTVVIFLGDNGTPDAASIWPFSPYQAKGTVFEGGVNVPLIVRAPQVTTPGAWCEGLVNSTDLFATVLELAGVDLQQSLPQNHKLDSVSLVPYLSNPAQPSLREFVFSETFFPTGFAPETQQRAVRGERFKLRRVGFSNDRDELYDLWVDPFERFDLLDLGLSGLTAEQLGAYHWLDTRMNQVLGS